MTDRVILVDRIGKRYRIGERNPHHRLRDSIQMALTSPVRFWTQRRKHQPEFIWALKDVSFEVQAGQVIGIIGRNGAGKSTLLKILSRVTMPTEGYAELRGRVGSLLEAGTGFHPELTGRENIFLSGTILGMKRDEIRRKFDEIVAFAEVQQFIDTPVKHYSSGMLVRLGFAVAAHLDPEILIVDEVLAVGDVAFQEKCVKKTAEVAANGLAVLLVSHNMQWVTQLCNAAYLLERGQIIAGGPVRDAVSTYMREAIGPH